MKLSEMDSRQRFAAKLAWECCGWVVGGLENSITDFGEDSEEGRVAREALADHDGLVADIYAEFVDWTKRAGYMKQLRFVGKAFVIERIERRLKKWGY